MGPEAAHPPRSELSQLYGLSIAFGTLWGALSLYERWFSSQILSQFHLQNALGWLATLASYQEIQREVLTCQTLWLGTLTVTLLCHGIEYAHGKGHRTSQG